ncbi:DUF7009 family protein [Mucilaginibacter celer]|uniref:Uncharacterized protein n=1 Tax=Mucilaginibacter celer TaxID=2305508 RepID=A0A494VMJ3_9SPHI|nr:hypothetical protein [Mucilaginibacter celer]AYL94891.1 hypothetical protein HYN43_006070 [Mucilaginibacter celer]
MKIRIKGNSLRYRLTRSDTATLNSKGYLEDRSDFGLKTLVYAIAVTDDDRLSADYTGDTILLNMPKSMVVELMETEKVGFEDQNGPVSLLVEKDFTCLDNTGEDQSDNYPNPLLVANKS